MPERAGAAPRTGSPLGYDGNVFINCPFDAAYRPIFDALVFAVLACGLRPRCALEAADSGEVRVEKIIGIIRDCRFGIHDISHTELNDQGLPRFNMPCELGLFMGAQRLGGAKQRRKSCLILDRVPYRYQAFLSDIAGQDPQSHGDDPARAIKAARDWLATELGRTGAIRCREPPRSRGATAGSAKRRRRSPNGSPSTPRPSGPSRTGRR